MDELPNTTLFKVLGHPDRLAILTRLMSGPATLSQLGEAFQHSPAHIRHHLKILEQAGLVAFAEARPVQGGPEKYYRATQQALLIHRAVLPEAPGGKVNLFIGSMDVAIRHLADFFNRESGPLRLAPIPLSSLDGLVALREGFCQMTTCHLINPQSEQYNRSFVRHLFPGQPMALVQVFRREEGLIVRPGNPLEIAALEDLARPEVRFVNREPGSGVRQWLDMRLSRLGIPPEKVPGYTRIARSHGEVAQAVLKGEADTGIGIVASARELELDFVPLFEEPYEIVVAPELIVEDRYAPFFEVLNSGKFSATVRNLEGYSVPQASGSIEVIR